jgi:hypothetical protein
MRVVLNRPKGMKPMLNFGIFGRIKDYDAFRGVRVSFDTIEWNYGVGLDWETTAGERPTARERYQRLPAWPLPFV